MEHELRESRSRGDLYREDEAPTPSAGGDAANVLSALRKFVAETAAGGRNACADTSSATHLPQLRGRSLPGNLQAAVASFPHSLLGGVSNGPDVRHRPPQHSTVPTATALAQLLSPYHGVEFGAAERNRAAHFGAEMTSSAQAAPLQLRAQADALAGRLGAAPLGRDATGQLYEALAANSAASPLQAAAALLLHARDAPLLDPAVAALLPPASLPRPPDPLSAVTGLKRPRAPEATPLGAAQRLRIASDDASRRFAPPAASALADAALQRSSQAAELRPGGSDSDALMTKITSSPKFCTVDSNMLDILLDPLLSDVDKLTLAQAETVYLSRTFEQMMRQNLRSICSCLITLRQLYAALVKLEGREKVLRMMRPDIREMFQHAQPGGGSPGAAARPAETTGGDGEAASRDAASTSHVAPEKTGKEPTEALSTSEMEALEGLIGISKCQPLATLAVVSAAAEPSTAGEQTKDDGEFSNLNSNSLLLLMTRNANAVKAMHATLEQSFFAVQQTVRGWKGLPVPKLGMLLNAVFNL